MDQPISAKAKFIAMAFFIVTLAGLSGCEGDTGPAGAPGTPATFGNVGCTDCHHLNNLPVNEFTETFISGLAGPDTVIAGGSSTTVSFVSSKLPAGETPKSFQWTLTGGQTATFSASTGSSTLVTLPTITNYKAELVKHVGGLLITEETTTTVVSDRTAVVPVNPLNLEEASTAELKLRVATNSGKYFFGLVKVADSTGQAAVENFAAVNPGIATVPLNVPVLLRSKTAGSYAWTVTGPAGPVTVNDSTSQLADFTPVSAGTYTVSVNSQTFTVHAGAWRGEIIGTDANNVPTPDTDCTGCHNNTTATDNFTPWKTSGHAHIFSQNLNAGGHYGPDCFPCHTVGFDTNPLAVNNGFDDQPNYSTFIADTSMFATSADPARYQRMWSSATYSALAKETNVQCENCHGPQAGDGGVGFVSSHETSTTAPGREGPRTSMSADVCGICHGEPLRHARFQQWEESGHGNFALAVDEGLATASSTTLRDSCARCHTAQGFMIYLAQLQAGNPGNLPTNIPATIDTVQPQTCQVCHDPHAEGTTSGVPNDATVRVTENTPKLPGGFLATGVGRGAICIVCHNSRNGVSEGDAFLHEDGDPVFGTLTAYNAPHASCQGDVLMGHNAYFVGSGTYRSPHSLIPDTCTNCHMELTPPPPLLSYNLAGTNHTFKPSLTICSQCHGVNMSLGPMLQATVGSTLKVLEDSIKNVIVSRYTGTTVPIDLIVDLGGRGTINIISSGTPTTLNLNNARGVRVSDLGTDDLAKALWNFYLIDEDQSAGVHNPDFTFAVLGASQIAVDGIPLEPPVITQ
ncbi:MAG: hypothetical protein A2010_11990 [Nitrospirae bacterium GWD2_57_9]|nr:MAG: hypothetical protein A2010_11990 [Nitrospirae bacterium GWD2_57_9]